MDDAGSDNRLPNIIGKKTTAASFFFLPLTRRRPYSEVGRLIFITAVTLVQNYVNVVLQDSLLVRENTLKLGERMEKGGMYTFVQAPILNFFLCSRES